MTSRIVNPIENNYLTDKAGNLLPGGTLEFYAAGTSDALAVYSDSALTTSLGSTLTADSNGLLPDFHMAAGTEYKCIGKNSSGATQWTRDEIFSADSSLDARIDALESTVSSLSQLAKNTLGNGGMRVTTATGAQNLSTSYQVGLVADVWGKVSANLTSGTLTQGESTDYVSGHYLHFSSVTTSGAADVVTQFRMTSEQAAQYVDNPLAFKCKVYQDTGGAIDYTPTVYKCASKDDFSSLTSIQADSATSVSDVTDTALTISVTDMGDCSNGIVVEVKAALTGSVSSKNFRIAEAMCQQAGTSTAFDEESYLEQVAALDKKLLVNDSITAGSSMDYISIFSDNAEWRHFIVEVDSAQTAGSGLIGFRVSTNGLTFRGSAGDYTYASVTCTSAGGTPSNASSTTNPIIGINPSMSSTKTADIVACFLHPGGSGTNPVRWTSEQHEVSGTYATNTGGGVYDVAGSLTGFQLYATSTTFTANGRIKVWGSNTPF